LDKISLLKEISLSVARNEMTKQELLAAYEKGKTDVSNMSEAGFFRIDLSSILYYLGGAIVFLGISIFIGKNWSALNPISRLLVTLGVGVIAYFLAVYFTTTRRFERISHAFYLIAALILPLGIYTIFDNAGLDPVSYQNQAINALVLAATFYFSYWQFRKNVLLLFAILFSTWLYFDVVGWFYTTMMNSKPEDFVTYSLLLAGIIYIATGYMLVNTGARVLTGFLYSFGIIGVLLAGICLTGWKPEQNHYWEVIFPFMTFASFIMSIKLESRSFLVFGTIFIIAYILKMADEYYTGGPMGPLLLVIIGLLLIAIGYGAVRLNNKYLSRR
jgi:hypothetical protein